MDKQARDKRLTEAMGTQVGNTEKANLHLSGEVLPITIYSGVVNFSTWAGFGKLWEWAQQQGDMKSLEVYIENRYNWWEWERLSPSERSDVLYDYFKQKRQGKV